MIFKVCLTIFTKATLLLVTEGHTPAGIYLLKVFIKVFVFIASFEHISHLALVFLLLTLNV